MKPLSISALAFTALSLSGCISFSSSESPSPAYLDACQNKEAQCREICGDRGVQAFSCSARPGEGVNLKCECRRPGVQM
jgi:hypothetical protein